MGSRAVAVLVRPGVRLSAPVWARARPADAEDVHDSGSGPRACVEQPLSSYVYTRTGRPFFADPEAGAAFADRAAQVAEAAGLFERLGSDWVLLDGEILPWNLKAQGLVDELYRPTAAAGLAEAEAVGAALRAAEARGVRVLDEQEASGPREAEAAGDSAVGSAVGSSPSAAEARTQRTLAELRAFRAAAERYVDEDAPPQFAVFQVLASAGSTWHDQSHEWHMELAASLAATAHVEHAPLFRETAHIVLDPADPAQVERAVDWWTELTEAGGEGMVVKPLENSRAGTEPASAEEAGPHEEATSGAHARTRQVQPGLKVRGREYLRMIYGPDYDRPERLAALRERSLKHKQSLALREYALGLESLERAVTGEPLHRVHLPVFAVLALESDPVDPRL